MSRRSKLSRRKHIRDPLRKFFIFCEGKSTEPGYFEALQRHFKGAPGGVQTKGVGGEPLTIAKQAIKQKRELRRSKNSYEKADEVWAVFDRDKHIHYYDAIDRCKNNGVRVGRSNPCFELWLVLHVENFDKPDDHITVGQHLGKLCPEYDPNSNKTIDYPHHLKELEIAENRAEAQFIRRQEECSPNNRLASPYTTVFCLTRAIRKAAEEKS